MRFKEEKLFERIDSEDIKGVKNIVNPDMEDADEDDDDEYENEEDEGKKKKKNTKNKNKKKYDICWNSRIYFTRSYR